MPSSRSLSISLWYGEVLFEAIEMEQRKVGVGDGAQSSSLPDSVWVFTIHSRSRERAVAGQTMGWCSLVGDASLLYSAILGGPRKHRKLLTQLEAISADGS